MVNSLEDIETVAEHMRRTWDLGSNPIPDLIDTLEEHGLKVFTTAYATAAKFDGLSARANSRAFVVVGSGEIWCGDRQRFTLAHELGHLVLDGLFPVSWSEQERERACDRFAGAFLAPRSEVINALGNNRRWLEPRELQELKHEFGLSMGAWIYRARDLGIISKKVSGQLWGVFAKRGWRKKEPDPQLPAEQQRRFRQLVFRALAEEQISESKAAELLSQSLYDFRALRNFDEQTMDVASDATDQ